METMCMDELKYFIQKTNFVIIDLSLYLNTHPDCPYALALYQEQRKKLTKAIHIYEKKYGPFTIYGQQQDTIWDWKDEPWPWQKECDC